MEKASLRRWLGDRMKCASAEYTGHRRRTTCVRPWGGSGTTVWGTAGSPVCLEQEKDAERVGEAAELGRGQPWSSVALGFYSEHDASQ